MLLPFLLGFNVRTLYCFAVLGVVSSFVILFFGKIELLSCQLRVTVASCFVYRVIRYYNRYITCVLILSAEKHLYTSDLWIRVWSSGVYKLMFYLTIVNKIVRHCHSWLARQYLLYFCSELNVAVVVL